MITNIIMTDRSVNNYSSSNNLSSKIGDLAEKYSLEKKYRLTLKLQKDCLKLLFQVGGKIQTSLAGLSRKTTTHVFRVTTLAEKGQVVVALSA